MKEELEAAKNSGDSEELEALKKENEQLKKQEESAFHALSKYCKEREINIGNVSTLAGLLKKLEEAGKE